MGANGRAGALLGLLPSLRTMPGTLSSGAQPSLGTPSLGAWEDTLGCRHLTHPEGPVGESVPGSPAVRNAPPRPMTKRGQPRRCALEKKYVVSLSLACIYGEMSVNSCVPMVWYMP